jgi:hypothetical protein
MTRVARESDFTRVGGMLRDELITAIAALGWEGEDKPRAEKIKRALERATPHRGSYLIDTFGWGWEDFDFLKSILVDCVEEDMSHTAASRGFRIGNTPIGRQIRALREKL